MSKPPDLPKKIVTLAFVQEPPRVLLGFKKRGFGAGRWNGFGGKLAPDETPAEAARRELKEECGVRALKIESAGLLNFDFDESRPFVLEAHIFRIRHYEGEITETEEMRPQWFHYEEIPYDSMWSDDRHWLPQFLEGKRVEGRVSFDENDNVVRQELIFLP